MKIFPVIGHFGLCGQAPAVQAAVIQIMRGEALTAVYLGR